MLIKSQSKPWKSVTVTASVILVLTMLLPIGAKADAVSDWSLIANTVVITNAATRPPASMIDVAYVHAAIYDAVNAIDGRYSIFSVASSTAPAAISARPIVSTFERADQLPRVGRCDDVHRRR